MTGEQAVAINLAVAAYAGWTYHPVPNGAVVNPWQGPSGGYHSVCPNFVGSYNAIIPIIQRLKNEKYYSSNPGDYPTWMLSSYLAKELGLDYYENSEWKGGFDFVHKLFQATPLQLCITLLKATKNWKQEYDTDNRPTSGSVSGDVSQGTEA